MNQIWFICEILIFCLIIMPFLNMNSCVIILDILHH